jgi:hypothetical protein
MFLEAVADFVGGTGIADEHAIDRAWAGDMYFRP